jgi:hypothetical protein
LHGVTPVLQFEGAWRFDSPGPIPDGVVDAFADFINKICAQGERKALLEHFKGHFARATGQPHYGSSSESWAETDLQRLIAQAAVNAPVFIEAFHDACEKLRGLYPKMAIPDAGRINRVLAEKGAGFEIQPPNLVSTRQQSPIAVPQQPVSLAAQAQNLIEGSLQESERLLNEGRNRAAVQELLWLLETVATAFRGISTEVGDIRGSYFNKIVGNLRGMGRGTSLNQILGWMMTLHGYLSAPKGGGIRHGVDLEESVAVQPGEARLYCNLIRSYIGYLITEHERLSR